MGSIPFIDIHALEETIRYMDECPNANYDDLVGHLDWYWQNNNKHPKEWMIDWIKCLTGEYNYEDFSVRRGYGSKGAF